MSGVTAGASRVGNVAAGSGTAVSVSNSVPEASPPPVTDPPSTSTSGDFDHLFRNEGLVSKVDLRVDVADTLSRYVVGDEDIQLKTDSIEVDESVLMFRGERERTVGQYLRNIHHEDMVAVGSRYKETVYGGVHQMAAFSAEAMVGGAYMNTIAGPYLRLTAWADGLAWGGWAEVDVIRAELSLLMIRSHVIHGHVCGARVTAASRIVDDFWNRNENFVYFGDVSGMYVDVGGPGGGVTMEA